MSDPKFVNIGDPFDCLQEEASEVIKIISKIKRFGLTNYNPYDKDKIPNFVKLENELKDLEYRIEQVKNIYNNSGKIEMWDKINNMKIKLNKLISENQNER